MNIKYLGREKFEIKTGSTVVRLGYQSAIDDFALPGPGEYEKGGVGVVGIPDGDNTIYLIQVEEINICYPGRIARDLPEQEVKEIGDVDILFLPLGEDGTLPVKKALDLLAKIDPRVVIPMLYADLTEFKTGEGAPNEEIDFLKIKKADLPEEERRIVILKAKQDKQE
ncbi:MAG: MBL fold metallo-hydrolase [Patescibacteria group bacterium]